jgi:ABC-type dipeptide/oligopeptide/nickel transport system ATPase component
MYAGRIVEIGSTREVFTAHRMPYTKALLESSPKVSNDPHTRLVDNPRTAAEPPEAHRRLQFRTAMLLRHRPVPPGAT